MGCPAAGGQLESRGGCQQRWDAETDRCGDSGYEGEGEGKSRTVYTWGIG